MLELSSDGYGRPQARSKPSTCGSGGRGSYHDIITELANRGPNGDRSRTIARQILLSLADGTDPTAEDIEVLLSAVVDTPLARAARAVLVTPLVKAARAVVDADPRFIRARLIELASIVARGNLASLDAGEETFADSTSNSNRSPAEKP
ncbi:MAG: hypothetical protein ABIK89_09860 [Planctomycetota bacterium]